MTMPAALGHLAGQFLDRLNTAANDYEIDSIMREVWQRHLLGELGEDEAHNLNVIHYRLRPAENTLRPIARIMPRARSRFEPRQRPRSPDHKASRERRRLLGGSSALPDTLRRYYTEGQRSVLCIVGGEVKRHGICDMPIDQIAALAGCCRTTVQTALHEARRLGHVKITERPVRGRKNLPNLVEITSPEWRAWIRRAPSPARRLIGSSSSVLVSTTKNTDKKKKRLGNEKSSWRGHGPPHGPPQAAMGGGQNAS